MKIAIIGMGNFGYAFLKHFDYMSKYQIMAYDRNQEIVNFVKQKASLFPQVYYYRE